MAVGLPTRDVPNVAGLTVLPNVAACTFCPSCAPDRLLHRRHSWRRLARLLICASDQPRRRASYRLTMWPSTGDRGFCRLAAHHEGGRTMRRPGLPDPADSRPSPSCGRRRYGALASTLGLTTGATTRLIDRLVASGSARRVADPTDRRRVLVESTGVVDERLTERLAAVRAPIGEAINKLDAHQRAGLQSYLRAATEAFARNLGAQPCWSSWMAHDTIHDTNWRLPGGLEVADEGGGVTPGACRCLSCPRRSHFNPRAESSNLSGPTSPVPPLTRGNGAHFCSGEGVGPSDSVLMLTDCSRSCSVKASRDTYALREAPLRDSQAGRIPFASRESCLSNCLTTAIEAEPLPWTLLDAEQHQTGVRGSAGSPDKA